MRTSALQKCMNVINIYREKNCDEEIVKDNTGKEVKGRVYMKEMEYETFI